MPENAPDVFVWTDENGDTVVGTRWLQEALPDPLLYVPPVEVYKAKPKKVRNRKPKKAAPEPGETPEIPEVA